MIFIINLNQLLEVTEHSRNIYESNKMYITIINQQIFNHFCNSHAYYNTCQISSYTITLLEYHYYSIPYIILGTNFQQFHAKNYKISTSAKNLKSQCKTHGFSHGSEQKNRTVQPPERTWSISDFKKSMKSFSWSYLEKKQSKCEPNIWTKLSEF